MESLFKIIAAGLLLSLFTLPASADEDRGFRYQWQPYNGESLCDTGNVYDHPYQELWSGYSNVHTCQIRMGKCFNSQGQWGHNIGPFGPPECGNALGHDFSGQTLSGWWHLALNARDSNFSNAYMHYGNLHELNAVRTNLSGATFIEVNLWNSRFSNAAGPNSAFYLSDFYASAGSFLIDSRGAVYAANGANFDHAHFNDGMIRFECNGCNLHSTDFYRARVHPQTGQSSYLNLSSTDLSGASLMEAQMQGSSFTFTTIANLISPRANLSTTNFYGPRVSNSDFTQANMQNIYLSSGRGYESYMNTSNFTGANLTGFGSGSQYAIVVVDNNNFTDADIHNAYLYFTSFRNNNFTRANLQTSSYRRVDVRGGNFTNANLTGTGWSTVDARGANFSGATMRNMVLCHANLSGTNLGAAADLSGATYDGTVQLPFTEQVAQSRGMIRRPQDC